MSKATDPTGAKPANIVSPIAKRKHEDDTVEACKEKRHCVTQDSNQVSKGVQSISIAADVVAFAKGKANFNQRFSTDNVSIAPMKSMAQRLTEISRVTTDIDLKLKVVVLMDIKEFGEEHKVLGKCIVADKDGATAFLVFFNNTIELFKSLQLNNYIKLTHATIKPTKPEFNLTSTKFELHAQSKAGSLIKIEDENFKVPFAPKSLHYIKTHAAEYDVFDCIGEIILKADTPIDDFNTSLRFAIDDGTEVLSVIAWGPKPMGIIMAAIGMTQRVFAYQRFQFRVFNHVPQLQFNEGAEVFTYVDDPVFAKLVSDRVTSISAESGGGEIPGNN
jgi:hypothetical protein